MQKYLRTLPPWINDGKTVVVYQTGTPEGFASLNGHDVLGYWFDDEGNQHPGKFYLKDLQPIEEV